MDYVTRQFINLTKKFRKELPHIVELLRRDIKQHTETIRAANKRNEQEHTVQPIWLDPILTTYQQSERNRQANDDRHYGVQNSLRWATWLAFFAASIYAAITYCQLRTLGGTLVESQTQTGIARQTLEATTRPWVGIPGTIKSIKDYGVADFSPPSTKITNR